ncbi:hypothetical protein F6X40_17200 [Paraburkholderia sp. UCT31]|uniref:S24/S26 family peptidase n=1 Tax=Paraburkholderia sp. UCT31 TaxID=2615209 RepID=UPI0016553B62|nr:S24/S26 family peptidase [Paraburkholderia sp. UCT31]MBC8738512.1 hypothetical protein [Paraburkholderia sp. UCT31]
MGWATKYIEELRLGKTIVIRPRGRSMEGLISSGSLVTVEPRGIRIPQKGDIVLCKVAGQQYLHIVKDADGQGSYLIGNNRGGMNGWTSLNEIFGFCVDIAA